MSPKPVLQPTADHPITVDPNPARVTVTLGGHVVADTTRSLTLHEAAYPAVHYIPLADVDASVLRDSEQSSYCPYKGEASYYSLEVDGRLVPDSVWVYRSPYDAVQPIKDHVAFYPNLVDAITEHSAS